MLNYCEDCHWEEAVFAECNSGQWHVMGMACLKLRGSYVHKAKGIETQDKWSLYLMQKTGLSIWSHDFCSLLGRREAALTVYCQSNPPTSPKDLKPTAGGGFKSFDYFSLIASISLLNLFLWSSQKQDPCFTIKKGTKERDGTKTLAQGRLLEKHKKIDWIRKMPMLAVPFRLCCLQGNFFLS